MKKAIGKHQKFSQCFRALLLGMRLTSTHTIAVKFLYSIRISLFFCSAISWKYNFFSRIPRNGALPTYLNIRAKLRKRFSSWKVGQRIGDYQVIKLKIRPFWLLWATRCKPKKREARRSEAKRWMGNRLIESQK